MLIDWFTVGAQALNFIILVWLMKRFLYKPILAAIDAREKRIAEAIADAAAKQAEAGKEREEFRRKNEDIERERAGRLARATEEAKAEGARLLAEARRAADALSAKRREALADEARHLNEAILRKTQDEVFAISRKALRDLASAGLEQNMTAVFIRKLGEMDAPSREVFGAALRSSEARAIVRSAFDLPQDARDAIQKALNETFSSPVRLAFATSPDRIAGIELAANGRKVSWSISDYLGSLESAVSELADPRAKAASSAATSPPPAAGSAPEAAPAAVNAADGRHA